MHSARPMTHTHTLSHTQAAQAAHARRFKPLPMLRRYSTRAPSATKALGKQPAISASKPETGKQRAGDFVIDLLSGVITYVYRFFSQNLPLFSAKLTIFFRKPECAHFGRFISWYRGYNSAVEGAMTRPVHMRFFWGRRFSTRRTT